MTRRGAVEEKSRGRSLLPFIGIFFLALAVRLAVSSSLAHLGLWQNPQFDAHENLAWAQALAAGDFTWPSPPTHGPAYPFFLALLLKVFGSVGAARVAQAALASATCVLVARTGEILFERRAGLAAGILLAVSGPLSLVDTSFWEESFVGLLLSSALLLLVKERTTPDALVAGALLGVATATRPTALLFVFAALAFVLLFEGAPRRVSAAGALLLGVAVVLVPAVLGSSRAAGRFVFVRAYGAVNVWMGNDPSGGGVQNARPNGPWDRLAGEPARAGVPPAGEEAYFTRKAVRRAASDPAGFARVLLSKLAWLTQAEEPRDNHAYAFFAGESGILRMLPGFGLLLALAAASGFVWRSLPRKVLVLLLWLAAGAAPCVAALAGLRYRMPVVPPLALFAGAGAILLLDRVRSRNPRALVAPAALAALTLLSSHLRRHLPSHVFSEEWTLDGNAWMELGKPAEAERSFRRAVEAEPAAALPVEFLGRLRLAEGNADAASRLFEESLRMDPSSRSAHFFLGQAREALGRFSDAAVAYRDALAISPAFFPGLYHLGRALIQAGDPAAAVPVLEKAVALQPAEQPPRDLLARARELASAPRS